MRPWCSKTHPALDRIAGDTPLPVTFIQKLASRWLTTTELAASFTLAVKDLNMSDHDKNRCVPSSELLARALVLAGEPAWVASDAILVISGLANNQCAVVGVEVWQEANGSPRWIASSDYHYEPGRRWSEYVARCAEAATEFIKRFDKEMSGLFNLTWISEEELFRLK